MSITQFTNPPDTNDPANFDTRADNLFNVELPRLVNELNIEIPIINQNAIDTAANALIAESSAIIAAGAANFQGEYDPMRLYVIGESVSFMGDRYIKKSAAAAGTTPVDGIDWLIIPFVPNPALASGVLQSIGGEYVVQDLPPATPILNAYAISAEIERSIGIAATAVSIFDITEIDANRDLILFIGNNTLHAIAYDKATKLFGNVVLVRSASVQGYVAHAGDDRALVVSCTSNSTALEAVVLTLTGTTISVGTPASLTLAGNSNFNYRNDNGILSYGNSFVGLYLDIPSASFRLIGFSVTGITVTIGTPVSPDFNQSGHQLKISGTQGVAIGRDSATGNVRLRPYLITGNTITLGAQAQFSGTGVATHQFDSSVLAVFDQGGLNVRRAEISGNAVILGASQSIRGSASITSAIRVSATRVAIIYGVAGNNYLNTVTEGSVSLGVGTDLIPLGTNPRIIGFNELEQTVITQGQNEPTVFDIASGSPITLRSLINVANNNAGVVLTPYGNSFSFSNVIGILANNPPLYKNGVSYNIQTGQAQSPFAQVTDSLKTNRAFSNPNIRALFQKNKLSDNAYSAFLISPTKVIFGRIDLNA